MKKNYLILVLLGVLTTLIISISAFNSFQQLITKLMNGRELRTERENLITLLSDLKDAETGQRGYIITGEDAYLEPYYIALQTIDEHLRTLNRDLSSFYKQKSLLLELSHLIKLKLEELNDRIEIRR